MTLTIVITTYNRALVLKQLLDHLILQTDADFQVVVAIDGSTDHTEAMLSQLDLPYPMLWVNTHCPGYGLAAARNLGILAASGEIVAIIDDDCFPVPGFVASYKKSARRKTITGGLRTPANANDWAQVKKMDELRRLPSCEPMSFPLLHKNWPRAVATECNICVFRDDLINLGLFSERLKIYGFIGQEFFARAEHFDFKYQFDIHAEIVHHRQADGDNSLTLSRKSREVLFARALRPSLMNPEQFSIQVEWAQDAQRNYPVPTILPKLPKTMWLAFPYRFMRNRASDLKRRIRTRFRGDAKVG